MRFLCRVANATGIDRLHHWNKGRRVDGLRVRRCSGCPAKQQEYFPGGGWKTVRPITRKRRTKQAVQVQTVADEARRDGERGMEPL